MSHAGHHRTHAEHLGERGLGRHHGVGDATLRLLHLGVEAAQVIEVLVGQGMAGGLDGGAWPDAAEQALGARSVDLLGNSTSHQLGEQGVQTTGGAVAGPAQVVVALGQEAQHAHLVAATHRGQ